MSDYSRLAERFRRGDTLSKAELKRLLDHADERRDFPLATEVEADLKARL
jgi:hypothetical protein